eukprot:7177420-Pyramimonas_sp.AAC.1
MLTSCVWALAVSGMLAIVAESAPTPEYEPAKIWACGRARSLGCLGKTLQLRDAADSANLILTAADEFMRISKIGMPRSVNFLELFSGNSETSRLIID